jgi:hypothetical protein
MRVDKKDKNSCLTSEIHATKATTHGQPTFQSPVQTRKQRRKEMLRKEGNRYTGFRRYKKAG